MKGNSANAALWLRAETRFRQLCGLGVGGLVTAPTLLNELRRVAPGSSAVIYYQQPGARVGIHHQWPEAAAMMARPDIQKALYAEGCDDHDKIIFEPFRSLIGGNDTRGGRDAAPRRMSDILPQSQAFVRLRVRDGTGYIGMVGVCRGGRDADLDRSEMDFLRRLQPFLLQALTPRAAPGVSEVEIDQGAMLVVNGDGVVRWATAPARAMLALALGSTEVPLPAGALRTVRSLLEPRSGGDASGASAWCCRSRWGRFEFRAQRLESGAPSGEALAGICVTRCVPLPLQLFEALGELDMAPRQSDVALRLALGTTQDQIARELGLSRATVVYHRRQVYNHLAVDTREQLLERLLQQHHDAAAAKALPLSRGMGRAWVRTSKLKPRETAEYRG